MDDNDKKIAALEKEVTLIKKQLAQAVKVLTVTQKKTTRLYHDHNNVARLVQSMHAQLQRVVTSFRRMD